MGVNIKDIIKAQNAAQQQQAMSDVEQFVRQNGANSSSIERNRAMLANLTLNRDVFANSLGNTLVRTRSELGLSPDFGRSQYDQYAHLLSEMQNPTDLRAEQQSGALKITNGMFGALTTAATTFLQPVADLGSLAYFINPGLTGNGKSFTERFNSFLNNPIQQGLRNVEKVFADIAPIYRYESEQDPSLNLFQRMKYGGWWAEDFIKNIGFTVGAALSGKAISSGADALMNRAATGILQRVNPTARELFKNTAKAIGKAGVEGQNIEELIQQLRASTIAEHEKLLNQILNYRNVTRVSNTTVGMLIGATTEAHIEALQARQNFIDESLAHINNFYTAGSFGAKLEYEDALSSGRIPQNTTFTQFCEMQKTKANKLIEDNGDKVMRSVYLLESLLLFGTNAVAWRDFYDVSFHLQRNQIRQNGMFLDGYKGRHRGSIKDVKERKNTWGAASRYLRGTFTEGFEEMAQSGIVEGVTQYAGSVQNRLYREHMIETDPAYAQRTIGFLNATWQGVQHMVGTHDSWVEGFIGGIMGAVGLPGRTMTKAQRKAAGVSLFNRKAWEMKGGLFEAYRQNEMDRNFAREFVNKVQNVFKDNSTPQQILEQFIAMETHMDAQRLALFDPNKNQYLTEKAEQFKNVLEIYRLTGNMEDLRQMYQSLSQATEYNEGQPLTEEQQSYVDLVKTIFQTNDDVFPISDVEILKHLHENAQNHLDTLDHYVKITEKISRIINVYEQQLTAEEATKASSLMTDALYKIDSNQRRIESIRSNYGDMFDEWIKLMLEDTNAQLFFQNEDITDDNGEPISKSALRLDLITALSSKLASEKDKDGNLKYLLDNQIEDATKIAEDVVDEHSLKVANDQYLEVYAQMLTNIVSEVRKYNNIEQKAKTDKEQHDLQLYFDQAKKIFDDIKGKKVTEYNEKEIVSKLKVILNKLSEYAPNLLRDLEIYANKFVNRGYENFNAFYYYQQLMKFADAKNKDLLFLRDSLPDIYQELLDVLPAHVADRLQDILNDPNVSEFTKQTINNFIAKVKNQYWYKSSNSTKNLGKTSQPVTTKASGTASASRIGMPGSNGAINTASTPQVNITSIDDAGKQLIDLFNLSFAKSFDEYVHPTITYDDQTHTLKLSRTFDGSKSTLRKIESELQQLYVDSPIQFGTLQVELNFDKKTVVLKLMPRNSNDIVSQIELNYFTNNKTVWEKIKSTIVNTDAVKQEVAKHKERGTAEIILDPLLNHEFIRDQEIPHFMLFFADRKTNGEIYFSLEKSMPDSQLQFTAQFNDIIEAAMSDNFQSATAENNVQSAAQQNDAVVTHTNGYHYYQATIDALNKYNELIQNKAVSAMDKLASLGFINQPEENLRDWAMLHGLKLITDENGIVIQIDFSDGDLYASEEDIIRSQRVFAINDVFSLSSDGNTYTVTSVDAVGHVSEAVAKAGNRVLTVSQEGDNLHVYTHDLQKNERPITDKSSYNGLRSTTPLSEYDFARKNAQGKWEESNINTQDNNKFADFPTLSTWLVNNSVEAYNTIGFGRVKTGDTVYFRTRTMDNIAQDEREKIQAAYAKLQLNQIVGGNTIVECCIMIDNQPVSIGFLNPVGAYAKTVIIADVMKSGKKDNGFFNYTTVVENVATNNESVIFYQDPTAKSSQILEEKFDDCIFVVKINNKIHSNKTATQVPKHIWDAIFKDTTLEEGQLCLIPYSSSGSNVAQPIKLIYGMEHQTKDKLRKFLNERFNFESLLNQAKEAAQNDDKDAMKEIGKQIHIALNDTFYVRDTNSNIVVSIEGDYSPYITIQANDAEGKFIPGNNNMGVQFGYDLNDTFDLERAMNDLLDLFLDQRNRVGLRISSTIVNNAQNDKNKTEGVTLFSYIQNGLIQTNAINIRTSNAHVILHNDSLDNLAKEPTKTDEKKTNLPQGATNVKGDTYQVAHTPERTFIQGNNYVMHSGGAKGSDSYWDEIADKHGITERHHYWYGEKTPKGNHELTKEEYEEGKVHMQQAAKSLQRTPENESTIYKLARNWFQVKDSKVVVAVSTIKSNNKELYGGTAWAVQMAIDNGIPVYVYDQNFKQWYTFDYMNNRFTATADKVPVLSDNEKKSFGAIGTRKMTDDGKHAVEEFMDVNFPNAPSTNNVPQTETQSSEQPTETPPPTVPAAEPTPEASLFTIDTDQIDRTVDTETPSPVFQKFRDLVGQQELTDDEIQECLNSSTVFHDRFSGVDLSQYNDLVIEFEDPSMSKIADQIHKPCTTGQQ